MALDNQDLVFASLMGSGSVQSIERFNAVQNELSKHVLPPIPFLPLKNKTFIEEKSKTEDTQFVWEADTPLNESQQFFPLSFSFTESGKKFLFPYEPMITISSGNTIAESNVAKQGDAFRGTIKERWSANDWDITITGVLIGSILRGSLEDCYPANQMKAMFEYLKAAKSIYVYNHALNELNILRVVIYDYSFPFTKGENVQAYEIKCKSDDMFDLLINNKKQNVF